MIFEGIAPFTMIFLKYDTDLRLFEVRWDGESYSVNSKDSKKPFIYSSCVLYSPEAIKKREKWFREWFKAKELSLDQVKRFHLHAGALQISHGKNLASSHDQAFL